MFKKPSTLYWAIFPLSLLRNSSLHYVLNKILYNGKAFIGYRCLGAFWSANNWPWPCMTDLASYLLTKWQFWQLSLKWLSGAYAQDKTKQYYSCFFFSKILFNYAIQGKFLTWLVNSTLNCTQKPISHESQIPSSGNEFSYRVTSPNNIRTWSDIWNVSCVELRWS